MNFDSTVILCWTGGWDSTFRLLQLLHDTQAEIQPLYLVDEKRESTPREIDVMRDIRSELKTQVPRFDDRLLPTDYGSYRATRMEPQHKEWWGALKERGSLGLQYPILASYAEQNGIDRIELSVERRSNSDSTIISVLDPIVERKGKASIPDHVQGPPQLLSYFTFPLIDYTKKDMAEEAINRGWKSVMKKTWFCFNPVMGYPCGHCTPCNIAQKEGMNSRVGWVGPALSKGGQLFQRLGKYPRRIASKLSDKLEKSEVAA